MRRPSRAVFRTVALVGIAAGLFLGLSASASASPTLPGIPDCKDAPTAQLPGSGITGFLDPGPQPPPPPLDPFVPNPKTSVYEQYGYAGLSWHTYDLGCGGGMRDIDASMDTATGNFMLSAATWGTAATNGLHNKIAHPEQYMAPLDDVVTSVTQRLHDSIWSPWGGAALLGVGALLLFYSIHGRLSAVTSAAAWALLVLAIVAGIGQYPTRVATFFDTTVTSTIASINSGVSGLTNLPPSSDPARAQGALVVDRVLYDGWLRGELGTTDSHAAKKWGPDLFRASAFTWAEADRAAKNPDAGRRIAERKAENWKKTAAEIQQQDPVAYAYLQSKSGGRAGTGVMILLGSLFTLAFRLVADIFLFAGLVLLRLLVMMFPAVAVIGVMAPMAGIVRRVFSMGGAAVINVIAFSAGAAVHTTVISAILSQASNTGMGVLGLVLCLVVTAAAFIILYPLLSFSSILGQSGAGHRILRRGGREAFNFALRRQATKQGMEAAQENAVDPHSEVAATGPHSRRSVDVGHLRAETFARPATTLTAPVGDGAHALAAPAHLQLTAVESPRAEPVWPPPVTPPNIPALDVAASPLEDPAYALASSLPREPSELPTERQPLAKRGEALAGVLVDRLPEDMEELPNLAHDSHTLYRRDGVGPRLYDPDTKRTVLSLQKRPEE
jgi:hypothetical protein